MTFVDALDINTFWVVLSVIEHPVVPILLDVIPGAQETQKYSKGISFEFVLLLLSV